MQQTFSHSPRGVAVLFALIHDQLDEDLFGRHSKRFLSDEICFPGATGWELTDFPKRDSPIPEASHGKKVRAQALPWCRSSLRPFAKYCRQAVHISKQAVHAAFAHRELGSKSKDGVRSTAATLKR